MVLVLMSIIESLLVRLLRRSGMSLHNPRRNHIGEAVQSGYANEIIYDLHHKERCDYSRYKYEFTTITNGFTA